MRIKIIFLAAILSTVISCDKITEEIKSDNILFSNLSDPISASTVIDWDILDRGVCTQKTPIPGDSSATILLDINNDAENDFKIALSHNFFPHTQYCGHCSIYEYNITIQGINSSDSITIDEEWGGAKYFGDSVTITFNNSWTDKAILKRENKCNPAYLGMIDDYVGFKHNNQIGWIKIHFTSINGLVIENYAINLTEQNSIYGGQTE